MESAKNILCKVSKSFEILEFELSRYLIINVVVQSWRIFFCFLQKKWRIWIPIKGFYDEWTPGLRIFFECFELVVVFPDVEMDMVIIVSWIILTNDISDQVFRNVWMPIV